MDSIMEVKKLTNIPNIKAVKNPATWKPGTNSDTVYIMKTFMTIKNNPKVNTVKGMVKTTKMGFTKLFNNPNTTATNNAVIVLSTVTPFIK